MFTRASARGDYRDLAARLSIRNILLKGARSKWPTLLVIIGCRTAAVARHAVARRPETLHMPDRRIHHPCTRRRRWHCRNRKRAGRIRALADRASDQRCTTHYGSPKTGPQVPQKNSMDSRSTYRCTFCYKQFPRPFAKSHQVNWPTAGLRLFLPVLSQAPRAWPPPRLRPRHLYGARTENPPGVS
jgi:hypothetical protein